MRVTYFVPRMLFVVAVLGLSGLPAATFAEGDDGSSSAESSRVQQGKQLAFTRSKGNCLACHEIKGGKLNGNVGPPLKNIKSRYPERELLFKRVWNERQFNPTTVMPPFGPHKILSKSEIRKIVDYLYTL